MWVIVNVNFDFAYYKTDLIKFKFAWLYSVYFGARIFDV